MSTRPAIPGQGGDVGEVTRMVARRLQAAGVPSPRADAELLLAHVLQTSRGEVVAAALRGDALTPPQAARLARLVERRERREPLQHLTGVAPFRALSLRVGPGVFVPRPETEVTAGLAVDAARAAAASGRVPLVLDLCTGSGAIALAVATEVPTATVVAVELDDDALSWAHRNLDALDAADALDRAERRQTGAGLAERVRLVHGDVRHPLPLHLHACVDVVVANPPYVPPGAVPREVEVREHDPALALYGGGSDGLDLPRAVIARAHEALREQGLVVIEHAEGQGPALRQALTAPAWREATTHADLAGSPRCTSARRVR